MDDYGSNSDQASDLGSDPQSERSSTRPKRKSNRRRTDVDLTDETPELRPDQRRLNAEQSDQLSDVQSNASQLRSNLISEIGRFVRLPPSNQGAASGQNPTDAPERNITKRTASNRDKRDKRTRKSSKSKKSNKKHKKQRVILHVSTSAESSSNSSSESSDSDDDDEDPGSNWNILYTIWPVEKRPIALQNKTKFNEMTLDQLVQIARFDRENTKAVDSDLSASYTRDKKPLTTKFPEAKDDGFKKLHPARFERFPLSDVKDWWKKVPRVRSHQYKNLPLQYSGTHNKVTLRTIQQMHDRTKVLSFKHFHSGNINVGSKPIQKIEKRDEAGISSSLDFNWEAPSNLSQVSDALLNYCTILLHLWPLDQTGLIILRLVNKYNYFSCANTLTERVNLVSSFFNTVLRENAARAGSKAVPMDFAQQEETLKNILTASGFSNTVPAGRNHRQDSDKFKTISNRSNFPIPVNQNQNKSKVLMIGSNPVCFNFNSGHCRNTSSTIGCKDQRGREFAHLCNKWLDAKQAYCLGRHSRATYRH